MIKTLSDTSVPATPADDFGGISFDDANGITFSSFSSLSADYNVTNDDCGWGSPRFSIRMDTDGDTVSNGNIFVYMGPVPSFTGCTQNTFVPTGELIGSTDTRFDLTQLGGPFYGTYANALALLGSDTILRISLVTDGAGSQLDNEQEVWFDNVVLNGTTYTFTTKDSCKNGGWEAMGYKNQGDCVSDVVSSPNAVGN